jgi:DNA polymerase-3 subunit gamma/tau
VTQALYRRFRPETFAEVIGQEHVTGPLRQALRSGQINHAYLFSGPRGCGKTSSARILARCLNCAEGPTAEPCGVCDSCVDLARGGPGSLDVVEIDAASHGGVDDARDLRERATFAPVRDRFKIFILDEAHMVSPQGFNALLKIVEEPPDHVMFIFATTEPDKVIGTIRSRTHHYPFRLVPPDVLTGYLEQVCAAEGVTAGSGVLPLVVRAGAGSVRDALSVLDQLIAGSGPGGLDYEGAVALLGFTHVSLLDDLVGALAAGDGASAFRVVDRVISTGHEPRRFVEDLLERLRDLIVIAASGDAAAAVFRGLPADQLRAMRVQAGHLGAAELSRAADLVNDALSEMVGATSPRLQLELLMARLLLPAADDGAAGYAARLDRLERGQLHAPAPDGAAAVAPTSTPASTPAPTATPMPASTPAPTIAPAGTPTRTIAPTQAPAPTVTPTRIPTPAVAPTSTTTGAPTSTTTRAVAPDAGVERHVAAAPVVAEPVVPAEPVAPAEPVVPAAQAAVRAPQVAPHRTTGPTPSPASTDWPEVAQPGSGSRQVQSHGSTHAAPTETAPTETANTETATTAGVRAVSADTEVLRRRWPEVLETLKQIKRVSWILVDQYAQVEELTSTTLRLSIAGAGPATRFRDGPHSASVQQAVNETLGFDVRVEGVLAGPGAAGASTAAASGRTPEPAAAPAAAPAATGSPQPAHPQPVPPQTAHPQKAHPVDAAGAAAHDVPDAETVATAVPGHDEIPDAEDPGEPDWRSIEPADVHPGAGGTDPSGPTTNPASAARPASMTNPASAARPAAVPRTASVPPRNSPRAAGELAYARAEGARKAAAAAAGDDSPSPDDPDLASSGLTGAPLVAQLLGGTVIDEQLDDEG